MYKVQPHFLKKCKYHFFKGNHHWVFHFFYDFCHYFMYKTKVKLWFFQRNSSLSYIVCIQYSSNLCCLAKGKLSFFQRKSSLSYSKTCTTSLDPRGICNFFFDQRVYLLLLNNISKKNWIWRTFYPPIMPPIFAAHFCRPFLPPIFATTINPN